MVPRTQDGVDRSRDFALLLTSHQLSIHAYIYASLGQYNAAQDVLQQTNLRLWENASRYRFEEPFLPWAFTLARFEILSYFRDHQRDRLVFNEDLAIAMSKSAESATAEISSRQAALRDCLSRMGHSQREVLRQRYVEERSLDQLSRHSGRSVDGIKSLLRRLRMALRSCIEIQVSRS